MIDAQDFKSVGVAKVYNGSLVPNLFLEASSMDVEAIMHWLRVGVLASLRSTLVLFYYGGWTLHWKPK